MTDQELQDLIRLKRFEQPEEGYFEDFLQEFQQRQRSEMLNTSARGLFVERVKVRFAEFGAMRWAVGAGVAYAAVALVFKAIPDQNTSATPSGVVASTEVAPFDSELGGLDLSAEAILSNDFTVPSYEDSDLVGLAVMRPVDFTDDGPAYLEETRLF